MHKTDRAIATLVIVAATLACLKVGAFVVSILGGLSLSSAILAVATIVWIPTILCGILGLVDDPFAWALGVRFATVAGLLTIIGLLLR